ERDEQLLEFEAGIVKHGERRPNRLAVGGGLRPAERVAEQLLDDALLAGAAAGEQPADLDRIRERAVRETRDLAGPIDSQVEGFRRRLVPAAPGALELDQLGLAPVAERVVVLEPEADRIHQAMAACARRVLDVALHPLAPRLRAIEC